MINFFLRAKHWQLFLLMFALPMVFNMIFIGSTISKAVVNDDPKELFLIFNWFPLILIIGMFGIFGWVISVGIGLHKYVPKSAGMKLNTFKIFMGITVCYLLFLFIWMSSLFTEMTIHAANDTQPDLSSLKWLAIIVPLHFFSIFAMIYAVWFNAKSFKSIELGKEAYSSDYIGHCVLFWLSFIGIWIIQPKINMIVEGTFDPSAKKPAPSAVKVNETKDLLD